MQMNSSLVYPRSPRSTMHKILNVWTATTLLLLPSIAHPHHAIAPDFPVETSNTKKTKILQSDGPLRVEIDLSISDAVIFAQWIHDRNPNIEEQLPSSPIHEYTILVEIKGSTYDYKVQVMPMMDLVPINNDNNTISCNCNSETLLNALDEEIEAAAEQLSTFALHGSANENHQIQPAPVPSQKSTEDHKPRLGALGYTGIGLGVLGAGAITSGILLSVNSRYAFRNDGTYRSNKAPGVSLAITGSVALMAGIGLLITNLIRRKPSSALIAPTLSPTFTGILARWGFDTSIRHHPN